MKRLALNIKLLEDLHIGTGTGWGDIDALQVRDRRGWPVLPASHIKGLLREAAKEWHRLDPEAIPRERIDHLFGRPGSGQGRLQWTSAYLISSPAPLLLWGSTQIGTSGTAQEQSLRFVEYIPAGSHFEMHLALPDDNGESQDLLTAIIARCRQLGSGRNRGHGQVSWSLADPAKSRILTLAPPTAYPARLRLLLRNPDPVCLARTGHPGNLIGSESFIRGRSLRGAVAAACLARGQTEWAHSLLAPTLAWGDALPLPATDLAVDGLPVFEVLPIPLSIGTPKASANNGPLPWWASKRSESRFGARREIDQITLKYGERPPEKLKRPADGEFLFRATANAPWQRYRPQILERLHTRVPGEDNQHQQALFSTEEIAEGTLFLADLLVTDSSHADILIKVLHDLADHWLRIGRGGRPLTLEAAAWLPLAQHGAASTGAFTLLLESDLIARDGHGNFNDRLDAATLARLAGLPGATVSTGQTFSEGSDLFGFNAATGLPRLAQRAIKAGSVIHVSGQDAAKVRTALASRLALGESPEEGFGRFRLDRLPAPQQTPHTATISATPPPSHEEALCRQARDWIEKFGNSLAAPSPSQWGDFRSRIQAARNHEEIAAVFRSIDEARRKQGGKAWEAFAKAPQFSQLRQHLASMSRPDAQQFLEYFTRWQRALKKNATHATAGSQP